MAKKKKERKEKLVGRLSKKIKAKKILAPKTTITIKEHKPENIFYDESRFFKNELDEVKKEMWL